MWKKGKILVIEPDSRMAREIMTTLMTQNATLIICDSFTEAVPKIKDISFDCIIMDVNLPELPGYKAVPIIRAIDPEVSIIMTTDTNTRELEEKVREQNIYYYHIKSFDRQELKLAVHSILKRKGKLEEGGTMRASKRLLVVDDDPVFVKTVSIVLENNGYRVEAAGGKQEAMEKIKKSKPDLIILDIMMEKMTDGLELCYRLKHDRNLKLIPVLAMSAITRKTGFTISPQTDGEYFQADDYLEKPANLDEMIKRVEKLLRA